MPIKRQAPVKQAKDLPYTQFGKGRFPIVGIGASAGGLEALEQFFANVPAGTAFAFIVIQHLDPTHAGMMPELLQRITPLKVYQAADNLIVKPGCLYVIPPNKSMSILNGALHLFDPVESRGLRLPVDIFFRSLADDLQEKSIGIILSGMGSDGSLGLKAIKEKNGMVLVQDPLTAKFDGMPRSATEAVIADIIAPAEELPARLISLLQFNPALKTDPELDLKNKSNLDKIIILLREHIGHDFSLYKKNTLFRRIERRKGIHQIDKITSYVRFLQENPSEIEILFKELLIGVTSFFRDAAVWDKLRDEALPGLINELPDGYVFRCWVPGCSTGEEAYSLAIVFREVLEKLKKPKNMTLQVFATDLDQDAIEIARKGFFPHNITADVSPERINRFFTPENNGFRINTMIRELVVFAPQNVIRDPPFTKLDILTCRNMLIYMEPDLQKKLFILFNYSINPRGILVLGTSETLGNSHDGFEEIDNRLKIFRRTFIPVTPDLHDFPSAFLRTKRAGGEKKPVVKSPGSLESVAEQFVLKHFAPPSVLVDDHGNILYITGHTGRYLEPVAGKANWNIHVMAHEGLRQELPSLLRRVKDHFSPVELKNVKMAANNGPVMINLTAQQIEHTQSARGMIILVFTEVEAVAGPTPPGTVSIKRKPTTREKELDRELQRRNEDLQSLREEMQTTQEELKSINEELQSTNEELQSTNEELVTSKEEMQSLNEELQTVNIELQRKVGDYIQANDDMRNLLNSTEIATLFLDRKLNIRRFTDQVTRIFKLRVTDIGRPFTDLVTNLQYPGIESDAIRVIETLTSYEADMSANNGKWFRVRIMPYRTVDDRIDGLVITFADITVAKVLEIELQKANDILRREEK